MVLTNLSLSELMDLPLPSVTEQKRLPFRPSKYFLNHAYELINYEVFGDYMYRPKLELQSNCQKYWGMCMGHVRPSISGSYCTIRMMDKWFCPQWFITTLAHEMVHQYQWDIIGPEREDAGKDWLMSHGPSFYQFREDLEWHNISLKVSHSQRRWFKHQDLFKA